jgi:hypothetical protein
LRVVVGRDGGNRGGEGVEDSVLVLLPETLLTGLFVLGLGGFEGLQFVVGQFLHLLMPVIMFNRLE